MYFSWAFQAPTISYLRNARTHRILLRTTQFFAVPCQKRVINRCTSGCDPYHRTVKVCLQPANPANSGDKGHAPGVWKAVDALTTLFPLWVSLGALVAFVKPVLLTWFRGGYIEGTLAGIMMGMGLTLKEEDFRAVFDRLGLVAFGAIAQYVIMPLLGFLITKALTLPPDIAVGVILVSTCPGGTASNLVCFLAGANVGLSVLMTLTTTVACVFMTPLLMKILAGQLVPVNGIGLFASALKVVLIPLLFGFLLRKKAPVAVDRVSRVLPLASVVGVTLVCSSIVAANVSALASCGLPVLFALSILHIGGYLLGYLIPWVAKLGNTNCRTISIEVGLQNAGLGAALAQAHFASPLTAVPCAISATLSSILGSILAAFWRRSDSAKRR